MMTNKHADSSSFSSQGDGGMCKLPPSPGAPTAGPPQPDHTNSRAGNNRGSGARQNGGGKPNASRLTITLTSCNQEVYKSGPLFLSSKGIGWTSWKKRWFILTRTSLVFFRNDPSAIPPKGSEVNLTLGGIDLNSSGSVVVKADKKLLTVLFPDGRDGRAFTLKAETSEDLMEWKTALEEALADAPSATTGQNGILKNDQTYAADSADAPSEPSKDRQPAKSLVIGRPILLALEDMDGTPSFLEKALRFLEEHGVKVEGILRQAADVDDVEHRIRQFEQGKNEFSSNEDAHVIADCVKYILRELPSSPVPASCCNALLQAFRTDRSKRISAMRGAICETFPEPNRRLLQRILTMMQTVVSNKAVNRMNTSAVAACMAPLLLRPLLAGDCELGNDFDMGGDGSMQLLQAAAAANHAQAIVITLLEEYDTFFGERSMSSDLFSDSDESGSGTEELSDDESYEDDGEDYASEGSDAEFDDDDDAEYASSGSSHETANSADDDLNDNKMQGSESPHNVELNQTLTSGFPQDSVHQRDVEKCEHIPHQSISSSTIKSTVSGEPGPQVLTKSSQTLNQTDRSASTGVPKSAIVSNGPGHGQSAVWGRARGKKNLSMESIDIGNIDEFEIERLEETKSELQNKIAEEAKGNAVLQENLEKHKNALSERRLALEQDVDRLQEQLQKERELRIALEAVLKMSQETIPVSFTIDGKMKAELEDIALVQADVINLKQKVDDLTIQLKQQREHNSYLSRDPNNQPDQNLNHQEKLKDQQKDLEARTAKHTSNKSVRNKEHKADVDEDGKQEHASSTSKHVSQNQYSEMTSKFGTIPSKRHGTTRGEGTNSTTSALSKLTNRLNFLKERRTQIASEMQNLDKGRTSGQPVQNSERDSSDKGQGSSDQFVPNSDKGEGIGGSSIQNIGMGKTADDLSVPNLERGNSESYCNVDKGV